MRQTLEALAKAIGQLTDTAVIAVLVKSVLITLLVFVMLGMGTYHALIWLGNAYSWTSEGWVEMAAALILAALSFWFLFRVVALAVLQFFADEVVAAVERQHYPDAAQQAKPLPFARDMANAFRGIGRTLGINLLALPVALVLLVTGVGPAVVFLSVNAWLLGRELTDMAWLRHCGDAPASDNPVPRTQRLMLGGAIAGIMLVPIANLFAPIIGAAAGTHLTQRALAERSEVGDG